MDSSSTSLSQDRLPDWLAEALDVLTARRRLVVGVAIGLVLLGAVGALVAPSMLPPRPVVGVAVGIAAGLLATALALALDASDLVVRGSRHVRAAGGRVDVRVGRDHDDVGPLLTAVARHADDGAVRVALTPASRAAAVPGPRATALAEAIARTGRRVLLADLARSGSPVAGLSDVVAGERSLAEVVRFEQGRYLARLAVGSDPDRAIRGFPAFAESLPSDLEVLVVALPPLADPGVLRAAGTFDLTLVLVEVDRTERVDLIASLDAMDAAHVSSELVLIDPARRTPRPAADLPDEPDAEAHTGAEPEPETETETEPDTAEPSEPAAAPAEQLREEDVDDAALAHAALLDVTDATAAEAATSGPPAEQPRDDDAPAEQPPDDDAPTEQPADDDAPADTPTEEPAVAEATTDQGPTDPTADDTEEIRVLQGAPSSPATPSPASSSAGSTAPPSASANGAAAAARTSGPASPPSWATAPSPPRPAADAFDEDAAFEVARTSAALQQLAQQVWQRQVR